MPKLYSILICLLLGLGAHAQPYETNPDFNRTRNWHFGHGVGLRFDPDTITFTGSAMPPTEACAVHTDQNGILLLYSNGDTIWNANHEVIHNGNLALGHYSSRMGSAFAFHGDSPDSIYLFNTNDASTSKQLSFNLIVREADTFRVVIKDSVLYIGVAEPISIVMANENKDVWIVAHVFNGSSFVSYRLTQEGVISCPVISNSKSYVGGGLQSALFAMKFSLDGKYLMKSNTTSPPVHKSIELYEFNNSNGEIKFLFTIDGLRYPIKGVNFSKSNNLYIIERDDHIKVFNFYPYDSLSTVSSLKEIQLSGYAKFEMFKSEVQNTTFGNQLALNIYDSSYLALIKDHIDLDSLIVTEKGCTFNEGVISSWGLPNFNQSYFHTPPINFTVKLNCVYNTVQFHGQDTFSATTHDWLIIKQGATPMTANSKSPLIEFADTGIYSVRYIASNGSRSDTITKTVDILPQIVPNFLGNDTGWCEQLGASLTFQAPSGMHCYEWNNGSTSTSITADTTGIYWAKIVTPNFCVLYDTITVTIDTVPNAPKIYRDNDTLKTDAIADIYRWFRDNTAVGNNEPRLVVADTGIYELEIRTFGGCTAFSDTIHIPDTANISVNTIIFDGIKIYPNPFGSKLIVSNQNDDEADLKIYDVNGKVIYNEKLTSIRTISTDKWAAGIYLIKITLQNGNSGTYKLIKTE